MFSFESALKALKDGKRIARRGWNAPNQFAYLVPAASYPVQTGAAKEYFGEGAMVPYRAYMALKTSDDDVATWVPSGSDLLAEDWYLHTWTSSKADLTDPAVNARISEYVDAAILTGLPKNLTPINRVELDKIARSSGFATHGLIEDIKSTLGITDEEMSFIAPAVNAAVSHKDANKYIGNEYAGLALIYTMAHMKGMKLSMVLTDNVGQGPCFDVNGKRGR